MRTLGYQERMFGLGFAFLLLGILPMWSQKNSPTPPPGKTLRVAVYVDPPFVTKTTTGYTGFSIDLWEAIANEAGWNWNYVEIVNLPDLIHSTNTGKSDIAITNLAITGDRLKLVDFTQPYFDTGLQVMIDSKRPGSSLGLWQGLRDDGHLKVLFCTAIVIVVLSFILTVIDRQFDPEFHEKWTHGWAESFYHVMSLVFTGKASHRGIPGPMGKIVGGLWIVCGVALISYITAGFSSVLTANRLQANIQGPQNLAGKTVGTIEGSTGETYCRKAQLDAQPFENLEQAVQALVKRQVDAIVFDSSALISYDKAHPELPICEVGPIFQTKDLGFALTPSSPYLRPLNLGIISMTEDGRLQQLKSKYFGMD